MDSWIEREVWWRPDFPIPSVSLGLLCFRAEMRNGGVVARLFDSGAPNKLTEPWRAASLTAVVAELENRSNVEIRPGYMYVVRSFWFREGCLIIPPRGMNSSITELRKTGDMDPTAFEMFAGIGSWSFATKAINGVLENPIRILAAVDLCELACSTYACNNPEHPIHADDLLNAETWPTKSVYIAMGSPPCPLFSSLAGSKGFQGHAKGLQAWLAMGTYLRATQPTWLLLENVPQIRDHFDSVALLLKMAGYKPVHTRVVNVASFGPFHRPRWMGIWTRIANMDLIPTEISMWDPKGLTPSLLGFNCIQDSSMNVQWQEFSDEEWDMMQEPGFGGKRHVKMPAEYCKSLPDEKGLTITHMYGRSFYLDKQRLREFGLWCPYLWKDDRARKFGEWEISRGHLFPSGLILPSCTESAVSLLGNSVSPLQCSIAILVLLQKLDVISRSKSEEILGKMVENSQQILGMMRDVKTPWQRLIPETEPPRPDALGSSGNVAHLLPEIELLEVDFRSRVEDTASPVVPMDVDHPDSLKPPDARKLDLPLVTDYDCEEGKHVPQVGIPDQTQLYGRLEGPEELESPGYTEDPFPKENLMCSDTVPDPQTPESHGESADSTSTDPPGSQDSRRCWGIDDFMDLSPETPEEDRREREYAGLQHADKPLQENVLDIPILFEEATVLFHKADTFHGKVHPEDEELRRTLFHQSLSTSMVEDDLPPTLPFTVSFITPPDDLQAHEGSIPEDHGMDSAWPQASPFGSGLQSPGMGPERLRYGCVEDSPSASPLSRTSGVAMSSETAHAAMASTTAEGSSAPEDTLQAQATTPEPQGQGAEDTGTTAVRELLLKMSSGPVRLRIHESCPISVLKMIYAGESFHRLKINYLRVSLASQMAIRALPPTAYVWLDWSEGPAPGPDPWWKPTWKVIKDTLEQEWGMTCPDWASSGEALLA